MDKSQALAKAMQICSKTEKCVADIEQKLEAWGVSRSDSQAIIQNLKNEKFIDENRYASYFANDKFRFNQWGRIKIAYMLKSKKIPVESIENALTQIDEKKYIDTLRKILEEKARKTKFINEFDKKGKLMRYAQGKGFEFDLINQALKSI